MLKYICPHCKKPIYNEDALRCLYCGEKLNGGIGFISNIKYPKYKIIIITIIILLLLSIIIQIIY